MTATAMAQKKKAVAAWLRFDRLRWALVCTQVMAQHAIQPRRPKMKPTATANEDDEGDRHTKLNGSSWVGDAEDRTISMTRINVAVTCTHRLAAIRLRKPLSNADPQHADRGARMHKKLGHAKSRWGGPTLLLPPAPPPPSSRTALLLLLRCEPRRLARTAICTDSLRLRRGTGRCLPARCVLRCIVCVAVAVRPETSNSSTGREKLRMSIGTTKLRQH